MRLPSCAACATPASLWPTVGCLLVKVVHLYIACHSLEATLSPRPVTGIPHLPMLPATVTSLRALQRGPGGGLVESTAGSSDVY